MPHILYQTPRRRAAAWRELPDRFLFIFLFIGLGEEPGWRGFALPRLQKLCSPIAVSLIPAPIWALWHLPLMGNEFPLAVILAFLIALLGGTSRPPVPAHQRPYGTQATDPHPSLLP